MFDAKTTQTGHAVGMVVTALAAWAGALGQIFWVTVLCSLLGGLFGAWLQKRARGITFWDFVTWVLSGLVVGVIFGLWVGSNTPGVGWEAVAGFVLALQGTDALIALKKGDFDFVGKIKRFLRDD